jgi:hypothetical protein
LQRRQPADGEARVSVMIVDQHRVGVWRFGTDGGWPLVWHTTCLFSEFMKSRLTTVLTTIVDGVLSV